MSKRFTETDKWSDPWYRKLNPVQKCLFSYCCDNCNNAGFIEIDLEAWAFPISCSIKDLEGAWQGLGRGLLVADGWAFVRNFLKHQKHLPLMPEKNPAHRQIVAFFNEQSSRFPNLLQSVLDGSPYRGANEGLDSPIGKGIGIGIGDGNGKGKGEMGDTRGKSENTPQKKLPFGEFGKVMLTEDEHAKLKIAYGDCLEKAIDILDSYMAGKGKKYSSCYAVMKKDGWVWEKSSAGITLRHQAHQVQPNGEPSYAEQLDAAIERSAIK